MIIERWCNANQAGLLECVIQRQNVPEIYVILKKNVKIQKAKILKNKTMFW